MGLTLLQASTERGMKPAGSRSDLSWETIFEKYDPRLYEDFRTWSKRVARTQGLDTKTRELIWVALAAVVALPSPFIERHIHAALDAGATRQELVEVIVVAWHTGGGRGHAMNHGFTALGRVISERGTERVGI